MSQKSLQTTSSFWKVVQAVKGSLQLALVAVASVEILHQAMAMLTRSTKYRIFLVMKAHSAIQIQWTFQTMIYHSNNGQN